MAQELVTFLDIVDAVREEIGIQDNDTTAIERIKRNVNMVYLNEVVPHKRWWWLKKETDIRYKKQYQTGTCNITQNSASVTLSTAPSSLVGDSGSFLNYRVKFDSFNEIYKVSAHTALATSLTISSPYLGETSASASFRVWREVIDLPISARETIQIWHDQHSEPMQSVGIQELNEIKLMDSSREGFPSWYSTSDYTVTSGDELESSRFRQVEVWPAQNTEDVTLHVMYIQEATPLDDDDDEPLMPLEDRIILVYGALKRAWVGIANNEESAERNRQLFEQKLSLMAARVGDSFDIPKIVPNARYIRLQRHRSRRRWRDW